MHNGHEEKPPQGVVLDPGAMFQLRFGISVLYDGALPATIHDAEDFTRMLADAMQLAIAKYTGTMSTDWKVPAQIQFTVTASPTPPPPQPPKQQRPRLVL